MIQGSFTLGPFNIPYALSLFVLSAGLAHLILFILLRKEISRFRKSSDRFFNLLLVYFFAWRLSLILTNTATISATLTALLYLPGGRANHLIAASLVLTVIAWNTVKKKGTRQELFDLLKISILTALLFMALQGAAQFMTSESQAVLPGTESPRESGEGILLEDLSGKVQPLEITGADFTILNFWATWCPPCRAEIPEIIRYTRDYKDLEDTSIRLIGINMTSTEASIPQVLDFIKAQDINFPVLLDKNGAAADRFGIKSLPTTMVFNSQGELLETRMGAVDYSWLAGISQKK